MPSQKDASRLLADWGRGHKEALDELMPLVYTELRQLADGFLRRERPNHTLQPTALVHEAYLRLVGAEEIEWQNRAHFLSICAQMMRRILVDHARARSTAKRGQLATRVTFSEVSDYSADNTGVDLVKLDDALMRLQELDAQAARVVELRFFGGLTIEETAEVLKISPASVSREWKAAKLWLLAEIGKD